jgi:hypothetical protein
VGTIDVTRVPTSGWKLAWLLFGLLGAVASSPATAQDPISGRIIGPTPAAVSPLLYEIPASDARPELRVFGDSRDHRWEGLAIGASVFAIVGILMADALCTPDSGTDNCTGPVIGAGLVSAVVGGVLGGFIGSAIPKRGGDSRES